MKKILVIILAIFCFYPTISSAVGQGEKIAEIPVSGTVDMCVYNDLLYLLKQSSLTTVDMHDPANPVIVDELPLSRSYDKISREVSTLYLYHSTEKKPITIIDLQADGRPAFSGEYDIPGVPPSQGYFDGPPCLISMRGDEFVVIVNNASWLPEPLPGWIYDLRWSDIEYDYWCGFVDCDMNLSDCESECSSQAEQDPGFDQETCLMDCQWQFDECQWARDEFNWCIDMMREELETYSELELMMSETVGSPFFAKGKVNGELETRYFEFYERYLIRNVWQHEDAILADLVWGLENPTPITPCCCTFMCEDGFTFPPDDNMEPYGLSEWWNLLQAFDSDFQPSYFLGGDYAEAAGCRVTDWLDGGTFNHCGDPYDATEQSVLSVDYRNIYYFTSDNFANEMKIISDDTMVAHSLDIFRTFTEGNYLFASPKNGSGLSVYSILNPWEPTLLNELGDMLNEGFIRCGNYMIVNESSSLSVLDISCLFYDLTISNPSPFVVECDCIGVHEGVDSYTFDFGDQTATEELNMPTASHVYSNSGYYNVTVNIQCSGGFKAISMPMNLFLDENGFLDHGLWLDIDDDGDMDGKDLSASALGTSDISQVAEHFGRQDCPRPVYPDL